MTLLKSPLKNAPVRANSIKERENLLSLLSDCSDFIFTIKNNLTGFALERAKELEALTHNAVKEACAK